MRARPLGTGIAAPGGAATRWIRAALLAVLIGLVIGCGTVGGAAPGPPPATTSVAPATALPAADPVALDVDAIDASSTLVPLGLNPDETVEVPPVTEPMQAGWYRYGPTPGESGPAVILGHVNGDGRDGIFARLHELGRGDEVTVTREDGTVAVFTVTEIAQIPKSEFPTEAVYGDTAAAELRLITCGGDFDEAGSSYEDNVVVYAELTGAA